MAELFNHTLQANGVRMVFEPDTTIAQPPERMTRKSRTSSAQPARKESAMSSQFSHLLPTEFAQDAAPAPQDEPAGAHVLAVARYGKGLKLTFRYAAERFGITHAYDGDESVQNALREAAEKAACKTGTPMSVTARVVGADGTEIGAITVRLPKGGKAQHVDVRGFDA